MKKNLQHRTWGGGQKKKSFEQNLGAQKGQGKGMVKEAFTKPTGGEDYKGGMCETGRDQEKSKSGSTLWTRNERGEKLGDTIKKRKIL